MPPLPPDVDLYIPVDLWIIRKTDSDHVWENELTRWSFTSAKNRFLWIKKKNSIKKKEKKNPSWANVNFFVSPFTSTVSQYMCLCVWMSGWVYVTAFIFQDSSLLWVSFPAPPEVWVGQALIQTLLESR